jgi:hypothetical protein
VYCTGYEFGCPAGPVEEHGRSEGTETTNEEKVLMTSGPISLGGRLPLYERDELTPVQQDLFDWQMRAI